MATVHLARALGMGGFERLVAIKVMHAGLSVDGDFVAMFLDEARVAARIRHPNVVATLDMEQGPDGLFLVMEFVEGPSLSAMLRALAKKDQPLPLGIALRIMVDALLGLHAAHELTGPGGEPLNVVHRDVSPHNVLVGLDGVTKITDFGVARAEARLSSTRGGEVKGKLAYMSPQQVRTEPIDRRADVYAAGVVLWEMLTRRRLFTGDNDGALVLAVLAGALRTPRQIDERVPEPIDRECMKALSLDPDGRHPTALAFAEALEQAAEQASVPLATPRALAAFVKDLGAHKPIVVPKLEGDAVQPPSRPSAPESDPTDDPTRAVAPEGSPPATAPASDTNSQVSSMASSVHLQKPAPGRGRLAAGGLAVAAAVVASALLGARFLGGAPAGPAPAAGPASTPVVAAAPAPTPDPVTVAPPQASATASAASPPATSRASAAPPKTTPPKAVPAKPRGGGGDDWRPQGL
jgi:serine/threonine-protein kinase